MAILDAFIGVPQSKVAAFAILVSLAVVALAVVLGDISVPPAYRLLTVVFMVLMSIPSVLVTLVNITCAVSGSAGGKNWWCDIWAWVLTGFVALYSVLLIIAAMMVMSNKAQLQKDGLAQTGLLYANQAAEGFFAPEEMTPSPTPAIMNVSDFPAVEEAQAQEQGAMPPVQPAAGPMEAVPEPFEVNEIAPIGAPLNE